MEGSPHEWKNEAKPTESKMEQQDVAAATIYSQLIRLVQRLAAKRPSEKTIMPGDEYSVLLDTFSIHDCMNGVPVFDLLEGIWVKRQDYRIREPLALPGGQTAIDILNSQERNQSRYSDTFFALRRLNDNIQVHYVFNADAWNIDFRNGIGAWARYVAKSLGKSVS